jgi:hypothetical protein
MPIAFVLDENLRGKPIWHAIRHHNRSAGLPIDATRVGDPNDLPLGSQDADILLWAEGAGRIIVTEDAKTFPAELARHLLAGRTSPGVFVIRPSATAATVLSWLELVVADDQPDAWCDQFHFIP